MEVDGYNDNPSTSAFNGNAAEATALSTNFVALVGEQNGIANLPAVVATDVSAFVSRLLRSILAMAKKFKDRARRRTLTADDLDAAIAFYGLSLQFGYQMAGNLQFKHVGTTSHDLFVHDEAEINLNTYINSQMPKLPLEPSIKSHWLVIDGVQPAIPENPVPPAGAAALNDAMAADGAVAVEEDGLKPETANGKPMPMILSQMAKSVRKTEQVQIKTTTTHALSLEQQIFFKEITEAIMGGDENKRSEALNCLITDCGLQALLPRLSITIAEGVRCNIAQHNLAILIYLMRMVQALLQNESVTLERCLHELLPSIMSCILSRQLCSVVQSDNHWALREFSARLLATIAKKYEHPALRSRITKALSRAFHDPNCSLATLYGAVFALNQLGADTTRAVVAPKAESIYAAVQRACQDPSIQTAEKNAAGRLRAEMNSCMNAIERI